MAVINDKFQAQNGFESPNFSVDSTGKITAPVINVQSILLNGTPFVAYVPPEEVPGGGDDDGPVITNVFESLAVTGGTLRVSYLGQQAINVVNGVVKINSVGLLPGSIDHVDIGYIEPVQVKAYTIDMTTAPDSSASNINFNGAKLNGDLDIVDNVVLSRQPTQSGHATSKGYVDATATALAVAFGA